MSRIDARSVSRVRSRSDLLVIWLVRVLAYHVFRTRREDAREKITVPSPRQVHLRWAVIATPPHNAKKVSEPEPLPSRQPWILPRFEVPIAGVKGPTVEVFPPIVVLDHATFGAQGRYERPVFVIAVPGCQLSGATA